MIKNQTRDLNQFYSLGTDFQKYKYNEGAVKPLDMLAQSDQNIKVFQIYLNRIRK